MKTLEPNFTENGFSFEQVLRRGCFAIYRRSKASHHHFEVIKIRESKEHGDYTVKGPDGAERTIKARGPQELYPSSEQWGIYGFTFTDEDAARAKMGELESEAGK